MTEETREHELSTKVRIPAIVRTCRQIGLEDDFDPPTSIQAILDEAKLGKEVYSYLKNSELPEAKKIAALYSKLLPVQRKVVTIDHLIAAARADHIKVWGAISEEVLRVKGEAATMIAALNSPDAMRAASWYAGTQDGHQDRKLILQTTKVAPVPTNQINRFNVIGNKFEKNIQNNNYVPSLEDIVRDVDHITSALPKVIDVPRTENS